MLRMNSLKVSQTIPSGYTQAYPEILYNRPTFLSANNSLPQLHFYLLDSSSKEVLGHIAFSREENEVLSPFRAPFGGFELASDIENESFLFFAAEVLRQLKESHVRFVQLHLPPAAYLPAAPTLMKDLQALGFREKKKPAHHIIEVTDESFETKITAMERRKLRKAVSINCRFQIEKRHEYAAIYEFIRMHRSAKGHELSMSWEMLKEVIKGHKQHYVFCSVRLEDQLIAAAIMVRVSENVLYYYIPGHNAEFNSISPMVFLLNGLYDWSQAQGVKSIDLGTSYWANRENKSLATFKKRIGGVPTTGSVLRKALSS